MPPPVDHDSPLTNRQREIFNFMVGFTLENFYQPSYRDVSEHFGYSGKTGALSHIRALEKKGLITLVDQRSRAIEFHRRTPIGEGERA